MAHWMRTAVITAAIGVIVGVSGPALAKEQLLGTAVFELRPQRDIVNIGASEGQFKALRMEVRQNDVEVLDLKVVYGNGNADDIRVRETFKAGSSSRVIDLQGGGRVIKQIIVTYVAKGPAKIVFYGIEAIAAAHWERLGCKSVGFHIDHDALAVGRKEGLFSRIKLRVKDAPVEFFDLRIVFANGTKQDIRVRELVRPGQVSRAIDLKGDNRGISRIDLLYRSIPSFKGKAEVCVDGLQR